MLRIQTGGASILIPGVRVWQAGLQGGGIQSAGRHWHYRPGLSQHGCWGDLECGAAPGQRDSRCGRC